MSKLPQPTDIIQEMQRQVRINLQQCCKELGDYNVTGILKSGKVRELARSIQNVARTDSLSVVISQVTDVAITRVSQMKEKK